MNNADVWFFCVAFAILTVLLVAIRERLKRIEDKIDKLGK